MTRLCPMVDLDAPPQVRLAQRLRELRLDAEMTQAELARRTGIHRPVIARIERGMHLCTLETLARIARALGIDVPTIACILDEDWLAKARSATNTSSPGETAGEELRSRERCSVRPAGLPPSSRPGARFVRKE